MEKSKYNDEQIVRILQEAERDPVADLAKRLDVIEQYIYARSKKLGDFNVDEVKRLKQVEAENPRLRKLLIDQDLEIEVINDINSRKC